MFKNLVHLLLHACGHTCGHESRWGGGIRPAVTAIQDFNRNVYEARQP